MSFTKAVFKKEVQTLNQKVQTLNQKIDNVARTLLKNHGEFTFFQEKTDYRETCQEIEEQDNNEHIPTGKGHPHLGYEKHGAGSY